MGLLNWLRDSLAGPSPCNKRLPFEPDPPGPPAKPQPTGGRLIYGDRDPGPVRGSESAQPWNATPLGGQPEDDGIPF
jgi:hypothetical protein